MKYFAKHRPVEGEIKKDNQVEGFVFYEGELYRNISILNNKDPLLYTFIQKDSNIKGHHEKLVDLKMAQLFLCSSDIQEGDKFFHTHWSREMKALEIDHLGVIHTARYPLDAYDLSNPLLYKVIGAISREANWVKEGDEFLETDIKKYWQPGGFGSETWNLISLELLSKLPADATIMCKIKGCCNHFH